MSWVPLHVHSQYSILEASAPLKAIAKKAAEFNMPAAALTDYGNLFGVVEFFKACKGAGVKPIFGSSFYMAPGSREEKVRGIGGRTGYQLILLAKNEKGYHNLCELSSRGQLEGFYYHPRIDKELLESCHEGLVCLSGGTGGLVAVTALEGSEELLDQEISWHHKLFGDDYYFELQRHQMSEENLEADGMYEESWLNQSYRSNIEKQRKVEEILLRKAKEYNISLVATNASHYMERADFEAHEILLNVQSGEPCEKWEKDSMGNNKNRIPNPKRRTFFSHEFYFKSPEQMQALFADIPEAISNTLLIADKCSVEIDFDTKHYPVYIPPSLENKEYTAEEQKIEAEKFFIQLCEEGIPRRYTKERLEKVKEQYPDRDPMDVVRERLKMELDVIVSKNLCDYLLIVWDFIHWAKNKGIPVGPGRGSGAGGITLYLVGITDIEPLRFNLFFERFINPERMSYPDIDVDICMDRRNEVIDYTLNKYGKESVAQIITFGSMKAKMVIKDVGRVLSVPLSKVNAIAKLVPEELNITLEKALNIDPDLYQMTLDDEEAARIIKIGKKLEGSIRNIGVHAAGIIICSDELTNHIPLTRNKDSDISLTQFSMKPVEAVGMLKVDFLGLKTLTSIQKAVDSIKETKNIDIDAYDLPLDDKAAFSLLNQGKTLGVFQLESAGMQELARQLHLDKFEEIIAVVSLYRPGPMDMIPSFCARKHGREPILYDHEWVEDILGETYGIMVYQEQVMQIAQKLANYSLGEGDVLRRAMGKKDMAEMANQRDKFLTGAKSNGITESVAAGIFDQMEKFASYGFNKSHAAAYGYLSYATAYMKANYPKEWMAALMTCDSDDLTKVSKFIRECQAMDIPILSPDINEAGSEFAAAKQGIRFAMSGIKGIGDGVVEAIIIERKKNGSFKDLHDFIKRIETKKVGRKAIENLIAAGSFDFVGWSRDALVLSLERDFDAIVKDKKEAASGVMSLFSLMGDEEEDRYKAVPKVKLATSKHDLLMKEKELLGFFLTGHPMDHYSKVIERLCCLSLHEAENMDHDTVFRTAFIVETSNVRISAKSQRKFAILVVSAGMERYELPIWPDIYEEKSHLICENQLLYAVLQVDRREGSVKLSCRWLDDLTKADEAMMEACDRAYDRAKMRAQKWGQYAKTRKEQPKQVVEKVSVKEKEQRFVVDLNADEARLSTVCEVKSLFRQFSGDCPVSLQFSVKEQPIASLHMESEWGVQPSAELKQLLQKNPAIKCK